MSEKLQAGEFIIIPELRVEGMAHTVNPSAFGPEGSVNVSIQTYPDQQWNDMRIFHLTPGAFEVIS